MSQYVLYRYPLIQDGNDLITTTDLVQIKFILIDSKTIVHWFTFLVFFGGVRKIGHGRESLIPVPNLNTPGTDLMYKDLLKSVLVCCW